MSPAMRIEKPEYRGTHRRTSSKHSARSIVAEIVRSPAPAELLQQARDVLRGTESGWVHPQVTCFRIILSVLGQLLGSDPDAAAARAKAALLQVHRFTLWGRERRAGNGLSRSRY